MITSKNKWKQTRLDYAKYALLMKMSETSDSIH